MFEFDHRRRGMDVRPDPRTALRRAIGICAGGVGTGSFGGGTVRDPGRDPRTERGALRGTVGIARRVGVARCIGLARSVRVARAVRNARVVLTTHGPVPTANGSMEDDLVVSGRFVRIETRGERSGLERSVTVGFVEDDAAHPGAILVAAGADGAAWARNLIADPRCRVRTGDRSFEAVAELLASADHARAIRELILRYGTPSEGLGHGPSFRLRPVEADDPG